MLMPERSMEKKVGHLTRRVANTSSTPKSQSGHHAVCRSTPGAPQQRSPFDSFVFQSGKKWFDCSECHTEEETHPLLQKFEMIFACKKCKKCFRKDSREFEDADEYCPHCDNHFVIEAKTPKAELKIESEDVRKDARMLRDDRIKEREYKTIFDPDDDADRLG